ncbi:hypothetical protein ACJJTC_013905 [Scirpophaga incertulas]
MAAGLLLCTSWYFTIISGKRITDMLFALWELYPVALFQCCCSTELHHYGDYVDPNEKTIMIMNHRTRIDWNYVWIGLYHATQDPNKVELCTCKENKSGDKVRDNGDIIDRLSGGKSSIKFVLKDELKCVPCLGWIMQLNFFLYVKRNWQEDQLNLSQFIDYYNRLGCPYRVVLFPEGTDLSVDNKRRSDKYATGNNLALYKYVLHPRTTGWAVLCSRLRASGLMSVYDVTVAYDAPAQTEGDLLRGHRPKHVHFFVKRYAIEKIPHDESTLRIWLNNRWCEKETILQRFHEDGKPTENQI